MCPSQVEMLAEINRKAGVKFCILRMDFLGGCKLVSQRLANLWGTRFASQWLANLEGLKKTPHVLQIGTRIALSVFLSQFPTQIL